jgi:hypothetical protein
MYRQILSIPAVVVLMAGTFLLSAEVRPTVGQARITSSAMDSQGNTYGTGWRVIGLKADGSYIAIMTTVKYDKYGNQVWADDFPKNPGWDPPDIRDAEGWSIAVDRHGNVYVAGHVGGSGNVDAVLLKYRADWLFYKQGDGPEWVRTIAGGAGSNDQFWNVALDPDGFIYTTGYIRQANAGVVSNDMMTVKFDPNGDEVWRGVYNGAANLGDVGLSLIVDPVRRNVFATGLSNRTTAAGNKTSMVTIMYDASGVERWVRRYDGPVNGNNLSVSLALDPEGSVYVSGWSEGTGSRDFATVKYDVAGNEKWVARYDGPAGGSDQAAPYAVWSIGGSFGAYLQDNLGIIVTPEVIDPLPAIDYLMERVEAAGLHHGHQTSLLMQLDAGVRSLTAPNAAVRRNAANILVAFMEHVAALRTAGNISESAATELTDTGAHIRKGILRIPTNVVYVLGQSTGVGSNLDIALVKYNAETGRPMWNLPGQPGTAPGKPGTPANIAWRFNGPLNRVDRGMAMALNADGEIYLTGVMAGTPHAAFPQDMDGFTARLAVNTFRPAIVAEHLFDGGYGADILCTLATWQDPDTGRRSVLRDSVLGDLVVVNGQSTRVPPGATLFNQYLTMMYDSNLVPRWLKVYD